MGHPNKNSFNHSIAEVVIRTLKINGHKIFYHDLYDEKFDPILPYKEIHNDCAIDQALKRHCDEICDADGIIIIHPNWWGQPPAILKGWVDRVIRPGIAYEFLEGDAGEGVPNGLLKAKVAIVFNTSNTEGRREKEVFGDPLETIWKNCVFGLCGVKNFFRKTFRIVVTSTIEQRQKWLEETREIVNHYFLK